MRLPKEIPACVRAMVDRGKAYDRKRLAGIELELHSTLRIEKHTRAIGATWLDRQLVTGGAAKLTKGFGALTRQAVIDRVDFLVEQGVAECQATSGSDPRGDTRN